MSSQVPLMPSLHETQSAFLAAVLGRTPPDATPWSRRRLGIYRVNARENFAAALEAAFPLLAGLMGTAEFRAMARAYQRDCPSSSGNLFFAGKRLPGFLGRHLSHTPDAPLAAVARFEWLIQEVLVAADDSGSLDLSALARLPVSHHGELRLRCHPAVRLLTSPVALFDLWARYQGSGIVGSLSAEAAGTPEWLLIHRACDGLMVHRLTAGEFRILEALRNGRSLSHALDEAEGGDGTIPDLAVPLPLWVRAGVITGAIFPPGMENGEIP